MAATLPQDATIAATPAVAACSTPTDSILGLAAEKFAKQVSPIPHRFLVPVGTDSALPPTFMPRATEHIAEMIAMIARLIASGRVHPSVLAGLGDVRPESYQIPEDILAALARPQRRTIAAEASFNAELTARGHHFRTRCDTEVLVHLYERYGRDLVHALEGMFDVIARIADSDLGTPIFAGVAAMRRRVARKA